MPDGNPPDDPHPRRRSALTESGQVQMRAGSFSDLDNGVDSLIAVRHH